MSKAKAMKDWRKRLDEFDGDDEGVVSEYRWFVNRHRREHLADMMHEDGVMNDLIAECLADCDDGKASEEIAKKVQECVEDTIDWCLNKHMWWDAFTKKSLDMIEDQLEVDFSGMHEADSLRWRED